VRRNAQCDRRVVIHRLIVAQFFGSYSPRSARGRRVNTPNDFPDPKPQAPLTNSRPRAYSPGTIRKVS
jgi:hypothetical protein